MNKKMREIYTKMQAKLAEITGFGDEDTEKAASGLDELEALQKQFDLEERKYNAEKAFAEKGYSESSKAGDQDTKATGFGVIAKILRGHPLDDDEMKLVTVEDSVQKALISGGDATNGENYLIPEDVRTQINELRRTYISAKDLVTVIPTESLAGSFVFESGTPGGLSGFDDGDAIDVTGDDEAVDDEPSFVRKPWSVKFFGKIIPVSNILSTAEKAGLMAYLNKWFLKNAIITENTKIFASLKADKTAKALTGWEELKTSINVDLDPSCKLGGVIVTNQSGFDFLDSQKDTTGRPILQPNPANSTDKVFQDMPVKVFPDVLLPDDASGKHPIFYGRTSDGCWFIEYMSLFFASSAHAGFMKNQTYMRVIEGFDVVGADKDAYCYGLMAEPVPAPEG